MVAVADATYDKLQAESKQRLDHICELYNNDLNDSLIAQAPRDMQFNKKHGFYTHYYETWTHLANTYVFSGRVNTALKEVKMMHAEALEQGDKYGQALAHYAMGNAYNNMGYLDEAIDNFKKSLKLIEDTKRKPSVTCDIFSYYCDALNDKKNYQEMISVTQQWKAYLDVISDDKQATKKSSDVWYAYYYLACAQCHLGLNMLDAAAEDIAAAEARSEGHGDFIPMSILFYRGQLFLQKKDYAQALKCSNEGLKLTLDYDDKSSLLIVWEQRAEILKGLGQYKEAAQMYQNAYELTDSMYKKDARTQINELSTMFHVSELEMEQRLARTRNITIIASIIAAALALLLLYWLWTNRRLRRKNRELAIARDQAQASERMKSNFIKNISHEIRTPLNIVSGFAQILTHADMQLSDEIRRESSQKIQENTGRITALINQLLALSESSSRNYIERKDCIAANQLCLEAISQSSIDNDADHKFSFTTDVSDDTTIQTSSRSAVTALCALLDNAMKFTPRGGSIRMHATIDSDQLNISIEDTGCGIPVEKAERIFDEFVQLDEYKVGVGIGLTLARNIARQLGGDIIFDNTYHAAEDEGGKGARFVLTLPAS